MIITTSSIRPPRAAGRARLLAVTSLKRAPIFPEVPTIAESGYPGYDMIDWNGLFAANGTPLELVARMQVACAEAIVVITRNYDISVGAIVALSSYVGLDFIRLFPGFGPVLIAVPVIVGGLCGALNGFLVAYCRIPSVIVTLATLSV